jgi:hypothetical protein
VFHTLLFSRHHILDVIFRVLAGLVLISSATFLLTKLLMYLGIFMLVGIPVAYRMARIATDLKKRGLPPLAEEEQEIPPETAQAIIAEIKQSNRSRPQSTKMVAQQTLQIFETINARPPGWAATIGLLFVHAAGFGAAAVFAIALVFAQRGDFRDFVNTAALMPKHTLAAGYSQVWPGASTVSNGVTLVANFTKGNAAAGCFQSLTNRLPATASLRLFGESVLLSLPAGQDDLRQQWLSDFQGRTKDVFVDSTNFHAAFSLFCIAPNTNAAASIIAELDGYFQTLPDEGLIPPWQPQDIRAASDRADAGLARQTYLKLQQAQMSGYADPELRALEKEVAKARRQGDDAAVSRLNRQISTTTQSSAKNHLDRVRSGAEGRVDTNVVDLYLALNAPATVTNLSVSAGIRRELAQRMGQFASANGAVSDQRFVARFGAASRTGLLITVTFASFRNIADGPPALVEWLENQKCIGFKYDYQAGMGGMGTDEDTE